MMQDWTPASIGFLDTAAAHSDYYRSLTERIAAYFPPETHVCDAGCGLGELSLALLPYCGRVTAIERASALMKDLRRRTGETDRLEILRGDILEKPRASGEAEESPCSGLCAGGCGVPGKTPVEDAVAIAAELIVWRVGEESRKAGT